MNRAFKKKINELAKRANCPLNWRRKPGDTYQWDGKDVACRNQSASNIIHDIAHFVVASKKQRKVIDFGLGSGPETGDYEKANRAELKLGRNKQEEDASAIGIYWEKEFGMKWKVTARIHCWNITDVLNHFGRADANDTIEEYWKKPSIRRVIRKYRP